MYALLSETRQSFLISCANVIEPGLGPETLLSSLSSMAAWSLSSASAVGHRRESSSAVWIEAPLRLRSRAAPHRWLPMEAEAAVVVSSRTRTQTTNADCRG